MRIQVFLALVLICFCGVVSLAQEAASDKPKVEMLTTQVLVVNSMGEPLEGATVYPTGLRTDADPGSFYSWMVEEFGEIQKVETKADGIAHVVYPRFVAEDMKTSMVVWVVEHPEYAPFREGLSVAEPVAKAALEEGYRVAATAVNAETGERIKEDLYGLVSSGLNGKWDLKNGVLISKVYSKIQSGVRIMHIPESGPILWSELINGPASASGSRAFLRNVELTRGVEVRGKLDDSIPRPIKNGYVSALVVSRIDGAERNYRSDWDWWDRAEINEDGTFVFPSLPPGEMLQMIPSCDGFVTKDPDESAATSMFGEEGKLSSGFNSAQFIRLEGDLVEPTLQMIKATILELRVVDQQENPVPNCKVMMWPNQRWFQSGTQILGTTLCCSEILRTVRREGEFPNDFRDQNLFTVITDEDGRATMPNLPFDRTEGIVVEHASLDLPLVGRSREASIDLKGNQKNEITLRLEPKEPSASKSDQ
jgi:hypothetical protein